MILAAKSEIELLVYIAAAIWGVISWIRNKSGEETEKPPVEPKQRPIQQATSEEERLRKFLEVLGVPQQPQPRRPVPQRPLPNQRPTKRPAAQPVVIKRAPVVEPEEMALAGRLEGPAADVEQVGAAFDMMSKGMVLQPMAELERRAEADGVQQLQPKAVTGNAIRDILRSPDSLRSALVLREILGPPRSETM